MGLQADIEAAAAAILASRDQINIDEVTLDAIVNGPPSGPTSLVNTNSGPVKTAARVIAEMEAIVGTLAPLLSPSFTGTPTAPTPTDGDNSGKISTTQYLDRLRAAANGLATLDGGGKVPTAQLPDAVLGAVSFQGLWNATTNTPALASGVGTKGHYYITTTAGTTTLDTISEWAVGDWAIFDGTVWRKVDNTDAVVSVAGLTGAVGAAALKAALAIVANDVGDATTVGKNVLTAVDQAAARAALGVGLGTGDLIASNNLSDIGNAATARANLGLPQAGPVSGFRNKIINGNFDIWQRATSQTSSGYGSADRWACVHVGSTKTASRQAFTLGQTDVPGEPAYFMRHVVTSAANAANYVRMEQRIEGVRTLAGRTVKLRFRAKADASRPIAVELVQIFGTGGSPSADVLVTPQKVTLTTSWAQQTLQFAVPSIAGKTIGNNGDDFLAVVIWMDAGSNFNARTDTLGQQSGTFDFSQIAITEGTANEPFEERALTTELQLCQRYYCKSSMNEAQYIASGGVGWYGNYPVRYPVTMRATPTPSISYGSSFQAGSQSVTQAGPDGFVHFFSTLAASNCYQLFTWTASAEL